MKIIPYQQVFERANFDCDKPSLNNYILRNVTKDIKSGACTCFVIVDGNKSVQAYYTLSADNIPIENAPEAIKKKFKYSTIPVILLGRLAVDNTSKGKGFGRFLLIDALKRSLKVAQEQIGAVAVIVDPIDAEAQSYYSKYGFTLLPDSGRMFMTMKKIEMAFDNK